MMKKILKGLSLVITISGLCLLSGCNTVGGIGEDMQAAGDEVEKAAS
ncbi:MAG TPA: entericidin A/B family lipoprotein [Oceanipulchritudo sp.]|nr:entericidin A/B family lipoprotein [Oceanipulchritudo sp.]